MLQGKRPTLSSMAPSTGSNGSGTTSTLRSWMGGAKGVLQNVHHRFKKSLRLSKKPTMLSGDTLVLEAETEGQWPGKSNLGQSVSESQVRFLHSILTA